MTRIQKTVFILVALVALVVGLTVSKVLNSERRRPAALLAPASCCCRRRARCRRRP